MRNTRIVGAVVCVSLVALLGMSLGLAGCRSLDGSSTAGLPTSTSAPAAATTSTTTTSTTIAPVGPPVGVTNETSESPCLIVDAYVKGGLNYLVVDYIQVKWPSGAYEPAITNQNKKLRTFLVPDGMQPLDIDFSDLVDSVKSDEDFNSNYTQWGFFDISVKQGIVTSLSEGASPDGFGDDASG